MQALYRRYRPKTFDEVVGQKTTITALKNQIKENRLHHAYIFSGTRGTGKTSVAKIFARAVNCLNPKDSSPCNSCKVCAGILDESIFDVMEIDAASNNSVDDIRDIRENIAYPPAVARKKVYIIDEVHMLSKGAFNALLKILEEPPSHGMFILATTEPEKIPATILSRSQRFTFLRLRDEEIIGELARILKCEQRGYSDEALAMIAEHSDGSMRDSLSILDQILSLSVGDIDGEIVRESLGITDEAGIFRIVDGILAYDAPLMMDAVAMAYRNGKNFQLLLEDLMTYMRDLLFYRYSEQIPPRFAEKEREIFIAHAKGMEESRAYQMIDLLQKGRDDFRYTRDHKMAVEILLLKTLYKGSKEGEDRPDLTKGDSVKGKVQAPPKKQARSLERMEEPFTEKKASLGQGENPEALQEDEVAILSESREDAIINSDTVEDSTWQSIHQEVQLRSVACGALLKDVARLSTDNKLLQIMFQPSFHFHIKMLKTEANAAILNESAEKVLGEGWSVSVEELKDEDDPVLESMRRVFKDTPIELE